MATRNGTSKAVPGTLLLVVHDFHARSNDELTLAKGDRVELIERDDDFGDGWFLGRNLTSGGNGLFPEVYTTPAPKGTLTTPNKFRPNSASNNAPLIAAQGAVAALAASSKPQQPAPTAAQTGDSDVMSPQPPVASTVLRTSLPGPATAGARSFTITSDSPVMSETLSVIDEHITDMKSPRASYANGNKRDTVSSAYSSQPPLIRQSYIAGHETDEEEQATHGEDEVMGWSPARVAEYLEDHGVEKAHCEVFIEQEISGEVLLAMDQNSLFIKEFELGSVGRRLKTWHKIKALQDEVKSSPAQDAERSASEYSLPLEDDSNKFDSGRNRSSTIGAPSLPRALTTKRASGDTAPPMPVRSSTLQTRHISHSATPSMTMGKRDSMGVSPLQSMTAISARPENTFRPSAQSVRNMNHSRRHSSIDSTSTDGANRLSHRKQPSIDQKWQPGQPVNGRHGHTTSYDSQFPQRKSSIVAPSSPSDLDRGYFSSNEAETRNRRSVLVKRNSAAISPVHSRNSSVLGNGAHPGLIADTEGYRDPVSPIVPSSHHVNAMNAVKQKFGGYRSATTPGANGSSKTSAASPISPVVTRLDSDSKQSLNAIAASPTKIEDNASEASSEKPTPSPSGINLSMFSQAKAKFTGKRSISDAITKDEKVVSPIKVSSPTRTGTGSSTPSTENRSLDITKTDTAITRESTGSGNNLLPPPPPSTKRPRAKSKKTTSAYTRGLEKKTPHEQMLTCDYSGWMKKKSGSLMATWKTRLFILRGRRLSYYYSTDDTEEKGLIDISFHRVLPAANETLTGVLATVTGAGGSPSSPTTASFPTIAQQDLRNHPPKNDEDDEGTFIFKLVPPKAGLAKGVTFTKPTVHYFAVNSRQEGRLWMAALMKATIDRDDTGVVTTTYNQKTISLSKARARRERPPALKEETVDGRAELDAGDESGDEQGLGINGLNEKGSTVAGAEQEKQVNPEDASSIVASTVTVSEPDGLNGKEREAIALNS
ncbi:hypothetical protein M409DRAFT_51744 [Zasmidium cellare ATCC 36951]|uniref:Polarized growth protein Boi2 n=1 Tax=Zasmidium cellare ATCC 36951 TaxID=1080233 RepID=A0A6A6CS96_ZASCE|nr:uncharacterized protein M409DRAFT_51744 [Zasmidium cellare ATCC 36951]KAF2169961.1 hypothetical protein M409DRAFT_51744 [Zasmidium cellare ATCC 36951]